MEVAPLIHSRNSKFAVRPNGFSEIQWARSKILAATRNIDRFNGIRRIVAAKNGICIAGIVCTMKYFVNNCLTGADKDAAQPYIDVHGRLYGVFLGYAFKGNANEIPIVNSPDLWQWFKEYLTPEWEKKSARTVEVDYLSWDKVKLAHVTDHGTEFYDSAAFNEEELFDEYLSRSLNAKSEIAFCSNVENIQAVEDGIYTAVTTSASNVDKLKANMERKRREREEQIRREKEESERQKKLAEQEKKTIASVPQKHSDKPTPPKLMENTNVHPSSQSTPNVLKLLLIISLVGLIVFAVTKSFTTQNEEDDSEFNSLLEKRLTYCLNMN